MSDTLSKFKFEANISVFGTEVELKPMEGDEIGYRAGIDEQGITIKKNVLSKNGLVDANGTAFKLIPDTTEVRTIVYNRKTKSVEFAVKAEFKAGPMGKGQLEDLKNKYPDDEQYKAALLEQLEKRVANYQAADYSAKTSAELETTLKELPAGFILNKYPDIFTVNSVSIYVGPDTKEPEADPAE